MSKWTRRSGVQLAYPFDLKHYLKYTKPAILQPKLNGERCRAFVHHSSSLLLSSEENEITTLPHINRALESLRLPNIELDGELYVHGLSKQQIGSYIRRNSPKDGFEQIELHVFDLCIEDVKQEARLSMFYQTIAPRLRETSCLKAIESHLVHDYLSVTTLLSHYVSEGYEGIILRESSAPYTRRRTWNMMKYKPKHKDSYKIVGYEEEIDQYGAAKGMLGAVWCEKDGQRFKVSAGGFKHNQRISIWEEPEVIVGMWLLVKYPELTDRGVPNHAVALEITEEEVKDDD